MSDSNKKDTSASRIMELEDQIKRARADYANLEKRVEREREAVLRFANESLLLQVAQIISGLEMTVDALNSLLESQGFKKNSVKVGDTFDPNSMDAIDKSDNGEEVIEIYAQGYLLHDKIVQPAKVRVGKKKE
jgi:molecular chaperone GrpE